MSRMGTTDGGFDHNAVRSRFERKTQLLRGIVMRWFGVKAGKRFGLGRHVRIISPDCLEVGDDVTILDYGYLHCLSVNGVRFGNQVSVERNLWLSCGVTEGNEGAFLIGDCSFIGPNAVIGAGGWIAIGSHVQIGPNVTITAENHRFSGVNQMIDQQGLTHEGITIEDDCWIGGGVSILDGVTLGRGSVVGAGAVVTRSLPSYSVAVGVPARVIRMREQPAG